MARTASTMLELGTPLPSFSLLEPKSGETVSTDSANDAKAIVVMFICNHCPYVIRIKDGLAQFGRDYAERDVAVFAVNSNDAVNYPDDSPAKMIEEVDAIGYGFPYLFDAEQTVAKAFRAACTPEFYVFDGNRALVYRGQFDGARPNNSDPVTGHDLRAAVDSVLDEQPVSAEQHPSVGCSIKWRPGLSPGYFG